MGNLIKLDLPKLVAIFLMKEVGLSAFLGDAENLLNSLKDNMEPVEVAQAVFSVFGKKPEFAQNQEKFKELVKQIYFKL